MQLQHYKQLRCGVVTQLLISNQLSNAQLKNLSLLYKNLPSKHLGYFQHEYKLHGRVAVFLKQFLNLTHGYHVYHYFNMLTRQPNNKSLVKSMLLLLSNNTSGVYMELYKIYIFFYNAGVSNGTFLTVAHEVLREGALSLNYFFLHQFVEYNWLQASVVNALPTKYTKRSYKPFNKSYDFLFLVDGTISESVVSRVSKTPTHVIGVTSNITYARYYDTVFFFETVREDVQYFFIELALFAYLSGRRAASRKCLSQLLFFHDTTLHH